MIRTEKNILAPLLLLIMSTNLFVLSGWVFQPVNAESIFSWSKEFPKTQFERSSVPLSEIKSDGPKRDTIPPINYPRFIPVQDITDMGDLEPVLSLELEGHLRAYPLRILLWHELVNDQVNKIPILVSYCPLCNSGVVFDRRLGGRTLVFGNTGRIRHFDMVMYDLETESWWQQFVGEAIIGSLTGKKLRVIPARLESLARFRSRGEHGEVLVPNDPTARPYGTSPFAGTDGARVSADRYPYAIPGGMNPFDRVVVVGRDAWPLALVRKNGELKYRDLVISWLPGQNSLHDKRRISEGRDVGNILVRRITDKGYSDVAYDITFAFAFSAFLPDGNVHSGSLQFEPKQK